MALLEHLPDELWVDILSRLWHVASLCLVSRRMYNIALPMLYKKPQIITRNGYPSCIHLFLRTILGPGGDTLALYVEELSIAWIYQQMSWDDPDGPLFSAALTRVGLPDYALTECVQATLLLNLLPGLRVLTVAPPEAACDFIDFMNDLDVLQPVASLPIGLQSLRDYTCWFDMPGGSVNQQFLLLLLNLPTIRSINIPLRHGTFFNREQTKLAAGLTSSVQTLTFRTASLSDAELECLLRIPRALTQFRYDARSVPIYFDFRGVGRALRQQRATLESLVIDFYIQNRTAGNYQVTSIGSLCDWSVLRSLKCTLLPLLGYRPRTTLGLADVLPPSIRDLEIVDDSCWTVEQAVQQVVLLLQRKEMVPRLEIVAVYRGYEKGAELREPLIAAGETAGVKVDERWSRTAAF